MNLLRRIGVRRIIRGVIEVRRALDDGTRGQLLRRVQEVGKLPAEAIVRHAENRLLGAVRIGDAVVEILAAKVHVRQQHRNLRFILQHQLGVDAIVGVARRNREFRIRHGQRKDALGRLHFREDHADAALVRSRLAVRGVVQLEHDVAAGLDQLRLSRLQHRRDHPRRVAGQEFALSAAILAALAVFLGNESNADRRVLHPRITGLADERDNVVAVLAIGRPSLGELHVLIFGKPRVHHDILIIDGPGGRYRDRCRDLKHLVRRADHPAFGKRDWFGSVLRIARLRAAVDPGNQRLHIGFGETPVV